MSEPRKTQGIPRINELEKKRLDDFVSRYANNVSLESTAWDLRLVFGQVDLAENTLLQHTSMTIPWPQMKVLSYLIQVHLAGYEADNGRIPLPKEAVTPIPKDLPKELVGVNPETWKAMHRLYVDFVAANPEINPEFKQHASSRPDSRKK